MNLEIFNLKQKKNINKKISFISNRQHLTKESNSCPTSTVKSMPKWYKDADIFAINQETGELWVDPTNGGKIPTWKSCPAILDAMSTGYVLKTPCDIEFFYNKNRISARTLESQYSDFINQRDPMPQFIPPIGYDQNHFAWWIDWGTRVPEGYSVLYTQPMNRFDLPFFSTSGIIDNDKVNLPGTLPFFTFKGWTGVIPAGTPYCQLIPFKRENWESEIIIEDPNEMIKKEIINSKKYRVKNGGVYKNKIWERRYYK